MLPLGNQSCWRNEQNARHQRIIGGNSPREYLDEPHVLSRPLDQIVAISLPPSRGPRPGSARCTQTSALRLAEDETLDLLVGYPSFTIGVVQVVTTMTGTLGFWDRQT